MADDDAEEADGRLPWESPIPWHFYRLNADGEQPREVLVIGETADFVWVLDALNGEQWDVERGEFLDGLADGSVEYVRPDFRQYDAAEVEA